jgi:hypothetical protein
MLSIDHTGKITKFITGQGITRLILDDIEEKEILLVIAAKLHSIRGMLIFFTIMTILGIIGGIISIINIVTTLQHSYRGF